MKYLTLSALLVTAAASAQQTPPATYAPATIDGVTTPNGVVTVKGKSYIAVDALKARGLTLLKTNSFGLYRLPNAQGQPLKLTGCMNEWLHNGVDRLRIDGVGWNADNNWYAIRFTMQTPFYNRSYSSHFSEETTAAVYQGGKVVQPRKNPIQQIDFLGDAIGNPQTGRNNTGTIVVNDPDDTGAETLTRLMVPTGTDTSFGTNVMTFDLTCKK